tara:strand:- start:1460 stop:1777 length:318 start_codon:yes stop_codon:yes gene_type:complete
MEEYKPAIAAAAKHIYGEECKYINFDQMEECITRLYGDECDSGVMEMKRSKMEEIVTIVLGKEGMELLILVRGLKAMLNEAEPGAEYPIKWIYDIENGTSSIENK